MYHSMFLKWAQLRLMSLKESQHINIVTFPTSPGALHYSKPVEGFHVNLLLLCFVV